MKKHTVKHGTAYRHMTAHEQGHMKEIMKRWQDASWQVEQAREALDKARDEKDKAEAEAVPAIVDLVMSGRLPTQCFKINWQEVCAAIKASEPEVQ